MKKIYIIGPVGSGKTTLAKKLSKKHKIKYYELDKIVWNDEKRIKRSDEETNILFNNILKKKSYIIEDVGRKKFKNGRYNADIIYYIRLNKIMLYYRILKRWFKQKIYLEHYNYKPTIKSLIEMINWLHKDIKNMDNKINEIKKDNKNVIILNTKKIKELLEEK